MSMIFCQHCDTLIDTDFNAEHEDECSMNPECGCEDCEKENVIMDR